MRYSISEQTIVFNERGDAMPAVRSKIDGEGDAVGSLTGFLKELAARSGQPAGGR
jgi:hypothetical protein